MPEQSFVIVAKRSAAGGPGAGGTLENVGDFFAAIEDGGELASIDLALLSRLVELLAERGALVAIARAVGRKDQHFHAAFELVTAAVADDDAREPGALGLGGRRLIRAEHDGHLHLVAVAAHVDLRALAVAVADEHLDHAPEVRLVAVDLGARAGRDLNARLGRDLDQERREVDPSATRRRRAGDWARAPLVQVRQHLHDVVERIERRLDAVRGIVGRAWRRRRLRAQERHADAKALRRVLGFLRKKPAQLVSRQSAFGQGLLKLPD